MVRDILAGHYNGSHGALKLDDRGDHPQQDRASLTDWSPQRAVEFRLSLYLGI